MGGIKAVTKCYSQGGNVITDENDLGNGAVKTGTDRVLLYKSPGRTQGEIGRKMESQARSHAGKRHEWALMYIG